MRIPRTRTLAVVAAVVVAAFAIAWLLGPQDENLPAQPTQTPPEVGRALDATTEAPRMEVRISDDRRRDRVLYDRRARLIVVFDDGELVYYARGPRALRRTNADCFAAVPGPSLPIVAYGLAAFPLGRFTSWKVAPAQEGHTIRWRVLKPPADAGPARGSSKGQPDDAVKPLTPQGERPDASLARPFPGTTARPASRGRGRVTTDYRDRITTAELSADKAEIRFRYPKKLPALPEPSPVCSASTGR